jgi:hypothetical protein
VLEVRVLIAPAGEDIYHPALWAFVAADGSDRASWLLTAAVLGIGFLAYLLMPRTRRVDDGSEA